LPTVPSAPSATSQVAASLNLDASETVPTAAFDPTDATSYNSSTSTTVYDSLGNAHTSTLYFRKTGSSAWDGYLYVDGNPVTNGTPATDNFSLSFDSAGALTSPADGTIALNAFDPGGGASPLNITMDFGGTTEYGSAFAVNNLGQDGYTSGRLAGVDIDTEGVVFARYTNGQSSALGKVALAKFNNNQGLRQIGDTNWAESYQSGDAQLGEAGTSSFGQIQSGALEASNVDIAAQLVNLITAQRNFQANSEVISTADTITQTIINIR
jgi:flagellar hook protein FlgE